MSPNIATSIRDRLLNRARAENANFQLFLDRYACERFLYRLGRSDARSRLILKGASLLSVWMAEPFRATRDIDLLAFGRNDSDVVRKLVGTICSVPCPEDGLRFVLDSLRVSPIRDSQLYGGQRARIQALLGQTRATVQVDFGFGDTVAPEETRMPTLIDGFPAPELLAYPLVSVIAEKFEAMVQLGIRNSRMKDFHDIWALSDAFDVDGVALKEAVELCFRRRRTNWTHEVPDALTSEFYSDADRQRLWRAYGNLGALLKPPPESFEVIGLRMREFLGTMRLSILEDEPFRKEWRAGGPWRCSAPNGGNQAV